MSVYLVIYDLKQPVQNYVGLYGELKNASAWWHYLESSWVLSSAETLEAWRARIQAVIDQNDSFIILELARGTPRNGWLPKEAWEWLRQHLG